MKKKKLPILYRPVAGASAVRAYGGNKFRWIVSKFSGRWIGLPLPRRGDEETCTSSYACACSKTKLDVERRHAPSCTVCDCADVESVHTCSKRRTVSLSVLDMFF